MLYIIFLFQFRQTVKHVSCSQELQLNCNTALHKIMKYQENANIFGWEFSNFRRSLFIFLAMQKYKISNTDRKLKVIKFWNFLD